MTNPTPEQIEALCALRLQGKDGDENRQLKVTDNDKDEISVTFDGKEIRAWSYSHRNEQFWKMQMAREFVEGWYQATEPRT